MIDPVAARRMMVDGQVRTSDVTDLRLLAAMLDIPRERFVPPSQTALAYLDLDVPVLESPAGAPGRRLLKPMVLAKLIHAAGVTDADRVLDVGCATGYSSAVLARLAGQVVALEQDPTLVQIAERNLRSLGADNAAVVSGNLMDGWQARAPYDVIVLNGATEVEPTALLRQLKEGGRLVGVLGRAPASKGVLYMSNGGEAGARPMFDASAPLLPGFAAPVEFVF